MLRVASVLRSTEIHPSEFRFVTSTVSNPCNAPTTPSRSFPTFRPPGLLGFVLDELVQSYSKVSPFFSQDWSPLCATKVAPDGRITTARSCVMRPAQCDIILIAQARDPAAHCSGGRGRASRDLPFRVVGGVAPGVGGGLVIE